MIVDILFSQTALPGNYIRLPSDVFPPRYVKGPTKSMPLFSLEDLKNKALEIARNLLDF